MKEEFYSYYENYRIMKRKINRMGIGDWGLGSGEGAQSPIPNPQSPIPIYKYLYRMESY